MMRCSLWVLGLLGVLVVLAAGCRHVVAEKPASAHASWRVTAPGMEVTQFRWRASAEEAAVLVAARIDPARCEIRVLDARQGSASNGNWAEMLCPRQGAVINGSFFGDDHQPIGLLVADGQVLQRDVFRQDYATFQLRRRTPEIVSSSGTIARGVTEAIECKPRLVVAGEIPHFKAQGMRSRAAIGIDGQGRVIITATGNPLSLEEWAHCLREQFGCVNALNLDGGPSAQLTVHGKVNASVSGGSAVPIFLLFAPKR